jgi:hypothetical protein
VSSRSLANSQMDKSVILFLKTKFMFILKNYLKQI